MQGFTARAKYRKNGLIRFIGHLDTVRALLRAIRRARVEATYSQGFSPKLRLSFGPPLPLGFTSQCEYVDIRLARKCDPDTITGRIQAQLPDGLFIEEVRILEGNPPPLHTAFWAAEYEVEFPQNVPTNGVVERSGRLPDGLPLRNSCLAGASPSSATNCVLRVSWDERDGPKKVLRLVLRQGTSGGGRVKEVIAHLLGMEKEDVEKLRIHKKTVFSKGEQL